MSRRRSTLFLAPLLLMGFVQNFAVFAPSAVAQNSTVDAAKPEELSPGNQKRLELFEQGFFFKLFPKEPTADRLLRLEKQVFGVSMPGTVDARLDRIQNSLAESDPGTGKPLAPRNDQPKKAVTPPTPPADSATSQIPAQVTDTPPMTPVLTKAQVTAPPPPEDNIVLHISKERFDISGIKPDSYIHQVTSAMAMNPQEFSLAFERAKAEIQLNKWDRALSDLCDAINFIPSNAEYYLARAYVYTKLGNSVLARADLKQAHFYNTKLPKNIDFEEHGLASKK